MGGNSGYGGRRVSVEQAVEAVEAVEAVAKACTIITRDHMIKLRRADTSPLFWCGVL